MKRIFMSLAVVAFLVTLWGFNKKTITSTTIDDAVAPVSDWKFGVALWTFHTFNFPQSLDKVDSAGITYIEPNTFHSTGPAFSNKLIGQLTPAQLVELKAQITAKGLKIESIYLGGGKTVGDWVKDFEVAKSLGVKFVTAEPPADLLDAIDSLAGLYHVKVAIHEHWKGVSRYWNPDSTLLAIKGHPNFGVCADLGHFPKSGINPLDAVKKLSGHIIAIHLKDIAAYNDPKLRDVPVGTGVVDFPAIFRELKKQNFTGHIYIERDAEDLPSNLPSVIKTKDYYNTEIGKL
jgi:sugar phosphate isomerase/epimerase